MATERTMVAGSGCFRGLCFPVLPWYPLAGMALTILGAKLLLIAAFASPTPFWDQWDAEAAYLYKPHVEHTLTIKALLSPHNEHRILWSRLLSLLLLELNGRWDPILQMVVNAGLHVMALFLLVKALGRGLGEAGLWILALTTALLFAIPFGWENTLAGFQSQFYLLVIMAVAALDVGADAKGLSTRWCLAVALGLASYFAMASGALTLIALSTLYGGQILQRRRVGGREYVALAIMLTVALVLLSGVPTIPQHNPMKAQSLLQFAIAAAEASSWPLSWPGNFGAHNVWRHFALNLAGTLFVNVPLLCVLYFAAKRDDDHQRLDRLATFGVWVFLQTASLAYGRATDVHASRYLDVIVVGVVINVACLLYLVQSTAHRHVQRTAAGWLSIVIVSVVYAGLKVPPFVMERWRQTQQQTVNTKAFLATGDQTNLTGKPYLDIPYPSAERLINLASDPSIRSVLPLPIMPPSETQLANSRLLLGGYLPPAVRLLAIVAMLLGVFFLCNRATLTKNCGKHSGDQINQ